MTPFSRFKSVLAGALLVLLAGTAAETAGPPLLQVVPERPLAPDFTLPDLDGRMVGLADLKGKVVIVNFWATWCPPCRLEMPSLQRAWVRIRDQNVALIAIHVGSGADRIWPFAAELGLDFPLLVDRKSAVADQWPMQGLPSTFILDPLGRIAYQAVGGREWDAPEILETILALDGP